MQDVVFIDDSTNGESVLEMRPSGRNEVSMIVGVAEFSKSPMFDRGQDVEEHDKQVGDNLVVIQAPRGLANKGCSSTPLPQKNSIEGM